MRPAFGTRPTRRRFLAGTGAAAAGLAILPQGGLAKEAPKLNFYNWDTYIGATALADFKARTGISVRMDLYADNDELFARLKAGNPGYDAIVPTNDFVQRTIAADMLMPLDHAAIPNMANIEPAFRDAAFDPGRRHSIPYMWGTTNYLYKINILRQISHKRCTGYGRYLVRSMVLQSRVSAKPVRVSLATPKPAAMPDVPERARAPPFSAVAVLAAARSSAARTAPARTAVTATSVTDRRPRRRSSCQAGHPAPLHRPPSLAEKPSMH